MSERDERVRSEAGWLARWGGRGSLNVRGLRTATAVCALGALAACSDGAARLGGGEITTASLGISNQDRIIRKIGTRPAAPAPAQTPAYVPSAPLVSQPTVPVSDLEPATRVSTAAAASRRDSFGAAPAAPTAPKPVVIAPAKPVVTGGVPVIPPAPTRTAALRTVQNGQPKTALPRPPKRETVRHNPAAPARATDGAQHVVASGDTLYAISRRYGVSVDAIAAANGVRGNAIRVGQSLTIPGATTVKAVAKPAAVRTAAVRTAAVPRTAPVQAPTAPVVTASVERPAKAAPVKRAEPVPQTRTTKAASGAFSWPVRGKVIAGYGARTAAGRNDGIDIAVPVGTPVRAVADGKVLYSGSEIEGFGNLILVRHADSWVSAYANSSANLVKRGDTVRGGQTIAHSGETGDASQPQVHFELRRNSQPVDPVKHLK